MMTTLSQGQSVSQYSGGTRFPDVKGKILEETFNTGVGVFDGGGNFYLSPSHFENAAVAGDTSKMHYDESTIISPATQNHSVLLYVKLPKPINGDNYKEILDVMVPSREDPFLFDVEFYIDERAPEGKYILYTDINGIHLDNPTFEIDGSGRTYILIGYSINNDTNECVVYCDGDHGIGQRTGGNP